MKPDSKTPKEEKMAVGAKGLRMMIVGILVMVSGLILLSGGGSSDPNVFNYAMFDFRRLVAAPIVLVCGIATEYCVRNTAEDLLKAGFRVSVLKDCISYVDAKGHEEALAAMEAEGIRLI